MSARDEILRHPGVLATADAEIAELLDTNRSEVLTEGARLVVTPLTVASEYDEEADA